MAHESGTFFALWAAAVRSGRTNRMDSATDLAFWEQYAPLYDQRTGGREGEQGTLDYLCRLLEPTDSLLDVGAGTGRFALPLAHRVARVTALDHSPPMLAVLNRKAHEAGVRTIQTVHAEWPYVDVEPHDIVLAAWSLYRSVDLRAVLSALVAAARRRLVIVLGSGGSPPHRNHLERLGCSWNESTVPGHLYVAGALWEMGWFADAQVLTARRRIEGDSALEIARQLAPITARDDVVGQLAMALAPNIEPVDSRLVYSYEYGVGVVTLQVS